MMDINSTVGISVSEDASCSHEIKQLGLELSQCKGVVNDGLPLNDFSNDLTEQLHIQDGARLALNPVIPQSADETKKSNETSAFIMSTDGEYKEVDEEEEDDLTAAILKQSGYGSFKAHPLLREEDEEAEDEEEDDDLTAKLLNQSGYGSFKPAHPLHGEEDEEAEDEEEDDDLTAEVLKQSGYGSFKPAHPLHGGEDEEAEDEEEEDDLTAEVLKLSGYGSVKPAQSCPILLPSPLNLVSAMKGSREKQDTPAKKLTVTWAPDVYDPPPSAATIVRHKKPRLKSDSKKNFDTKKNGKNKQKGKSSKVGHSGKDKKGRKNKFCQSPDDDDYSGSSVEVGNFHVGSPDEFCAGSFLKKSGAKFHFSATEAM